MTNKELIEKLKEFPLEYEVIIWNDEYDKPSPIHLIYKNEDHRIIIEYGYYGRISK